MTGERTTSGHLELIDNGGFSEAVSPGSGPSVSVEKAVGLEGWWLVRPVADDGRRARAKIDRHEGNLRFVASAGVSLVQRLREPAASAHLICRLRLHRGTVQVGVSNAAGTFEQTLGAAASSPEGKVWQTLVMDVSGPTEQVFVRTETDTAVDVETISLRRPDSGSGSTTRTADLMAPLARAPRTTAAPVATDPKPSASVAAATLAAGPPVSVSLRPPAAVNGTEPGATANLAFDYDYGPGIVDLEIAVSVDGVVLPAQRPTVEPCQVTARVYRQGALEIRYSITGWDIFNSVRVSQGPLTGSVNVSLESPLPRFTIDAPKKAPIGVAGGAFPVKVQTSGEFGPRTVSWAFEHHSGFRSTEGEAAILVSVDADATPLGRSTLYVTVSCDEHPRVELTKSTEVEITDFTGPALVISQPTINQRIRLVDLDGATLTVAGSASDAQSGMPEGRVEVSLTGHDGDFLAASTEDGWANWSVAIPIDEYGDYTVHARAYDAAGNVTLETVDAAIVSTYVPATLDERLSDQEYLAALLDFGHDQLESDEGEPLSVSDLEAVFGQPFHVSAQPLPASAALAGAPVNELTPTIELLRRRGLRLLAADWAFDVDVDGSMVGDLSGWNQTLALSSGATVVNGAGPKGEAVLRVDGTASGGAVTGPDQAGIGASGPPFSVVFRFRLAGSASKDKPRVLIAKGDAPRDATFLIGLDPVSDLLEFAARGTGTTTTLPVPSDVWVHIACVCSEGELRIYFDGVCVGQGSPGSSASAGAAAIRLGSLPGDTSIDGVTGDFGRIRIYDIALDDDVVSRLATASSDDRARHLEDDRSASMAEWRLTTYEFLLAGAGTSYAELRLTAADSAARAALAARLGIILSGSPDQLTLLTAATPADVSEEFLESSFGLRSTHPSLDPLRPPTTPLLEQWRQASSEARWVAQEHDPHAPSVPILIDPDLVSEADLSSAGAASAAGRLLTERRDAITGWTADLHTQHTAAATPADGFAAMLQYTYGDATTLDSIDKHLTNGVNISDDLAAARLTPRTYRVLDLIGQLCSTGSVTADEWTAAEQILVQILKVGQYDAWHHEEAGLALTPALFAVAAKEPTLIPWRADATARLAWERLLAARIAERDSDSAGYATYLASVEQRVLPILRDVVLDGVAGSDVASTVPNLVSRLLALDVARSGVQQTTRVRAVTDVLQTVLFTTRFGRWPDGHPFGKWHLSATIDEFDAEWRWLGDADAWATAVTAYLFPESWLDPALLPNVSAAFATLVSSTRRQPNLDPDSARALAARFFDSRREDFEALAIGPPKARSALLFGESSGNQISDAATGWTGTCSGNVIWTDGLYGTAASFGGPTASIDLDRAASNAPSDVSRNFTISLWVKPSATVDLHQPGTGDVVGLSGQRYVYAPIQGESAYGADHAGAGMSVGTNGVSVYEHSDNYLACVASYAGHLDDWTHIGVVYEDGKPALYVDGELVATGNASPKVVHALPEALGNGAEHYGQYVGSLQNVRLFDYPMSRFQVAPLAYRPTDQRDQAELSALGELEWALLGSLVLDEPPYLQPAAEVFAETFYFVPALLAQRLQSAGEFEAALAWWQTILDYQGGGGWRYSPLQFMDNNSAAITFGAHWTADLNPHSIASTRPNPYVRYTVASIAGCLRDFATSKFATDTSEQIAQAKVLYDTASDLLSRRALQVPLTRTGDDPVYLNPYVDGLRQAVAVQVAKLRQARYVTGDIRVVPSDLSSAMTARPPSQPTPYHFRVLLDRAQRVLASAQSVEGAYLHALEMYDDRAYRRFEAQNGIDTATQQVQIQGARQAAASDGIGVARLQRAKADLVVHQMQALIDAGLNMNERTVLNAISRATDLKNDIVNADVLIGLAGYAAQAAAAGPAAPAVGVINVAAAAGSFVRAVAQSTLNATEAQLQSSQLLAGFDRQKENWTDTRDQAIQDALIGEAQIVVAQDQLTIATQESTLAQLQLRQAQATVNFLDQQFTNADLYQYMSGVLGGVYASLLQEATVLARQAEVQLAFERQIQIPGIVQSDYWSQAQSLLAATSSTSGTPNLRGLTGAERLLQDIVALEQFSMSSDQRRLNLTQTFSLSTLQPLVFANFLETGVLEFATPADWFDRAFPGHYLRLISQVRVSVIALVPPDIGIRATLTDNGLSRVVSGGDIFTEHVINRAPDTVALTSPAGASGVFTLDRQPDLLQPFESRGVVASWRFEMPPPANPIDYGSIADVMLSIDYTALYDDTYRAHVVQRLNTSDFSADRMISVRGDRPDAWYALNNPEDPVSGSTATLTLTPRDFTSQILSTPTVADLAVYLPGVPTDQPLHVSIDHEGKGGDAQADDHVISTLRGNAESWKGIRELDATGDWVISLDKATTAAIKDGDIHDIVLNITYTGAAPQWTS